MTDSPPFRFRPKRPPLLPRAEWLLGRYTFPYSVLIAKEPVRPEVILCVELPRGMILKAELADPAMPASVADVLRDAMERPAKGGLRRPERVRVANESLAAEVRQVVEEGISVLVAPTPELDEAFEALIESMRPMQAPSYFEGGASAALVERLFVVSSLFHRMAPWKVVADQQVIRADIESLDVRGGCLSVIGGAGQSFGLLFFRSIDDFFAFARAGQRMAATHAMSPVEFLSLNFERKRDLPATMLREIEHHGWPVAGRTGYPTIVSIASDGTHRLMNDRDVRIMISCASAFLAFFAMHRDLFERDALLSISESFTGEDERMVTITAPYSDDQPAGRTKRGSRLAGGGKRTRKRPKAPR